MTEGGEMRPLDDQMLEERMYRSSLKQAVAFMNTMLPPVPESEEESSEPSEPKPAEPAPKPVERSADRAAPRGGHSRRQQSEIRGVYKVKDNKKKTRMLIERSGDYSLRDTTPMRARPAKPAREAPKEKPSARKGRVNKFSEMKYNDMKAKRKDKKGKK